LIGAASLEKILEVDLTTGELAERPIPLETSERFLGGLGLNTWLLYLHTGPGTDPFGPENVVLISPGLLTGTEASAADIMETGERVFNLMRMYNVREGLRRTDDHWPDSFYTEPSPAGAETGPPFDKETFNEKLTRYYWLRGWNLDTGIPTKETLERLGIGETASDIPPL
jgi:aldehyde:ferredoxin oxidoreductase